MIKTQSRTYREVLEERLSRGADLLFDMEQRGDTSQEDPGMARSLAAAPDGVRDSARGLSRRARRVRHHVLIASAIQRAATYRRGECAERMVGWNSAGARCRTCNGHFPTCQNISWHEVCNHRNVWSR